MVKRVGRYRFSQKFKKEYKKLPQEIQQRFNEKLSLFLHDMSHPSLRVKRLQGTRDRWEASITESYRFTFEVQEDTVIFRVIGTHDVLIREGRNR